MKNIIIRWAAVVSVALGYAVAMEYDRIKLDGIELKGVVYGTEHLKLYPIKKSDTSDVVSILSDKEVAKYLEGGVATSNSRYADSLRLSKSYKGGQRIKTRFFIK